MPGVSQATTVSASYTAAQTNAAIVAVPPAGRKIVLQWVCISNGDTAGTVRLTDGAAISVAGPISNTQASPTVVTAGVYVPTGTLVTIAGSNSTPLIDGTYVATNVNATTFSIPVNCTIAGTAGTVTHTATVLLEALLAINTPLFVDCQRAPIVLSAAHPLCFTSVTCATHRVNLGYTVEEF